MKKFNLKSSVLVALAGLLASCGGSAKTFIVGNEFHNEQYGLVGRAAKTSYNALIGTGKGELNYLITAEAANATHFANFVDGLLLQNEYGVLEKNIASKVETNEDYSKFTFTIPEKKVPWVTYKGKQYVASVNGKKVAQYVSPEDFVASAKIVSSYKNASDLQYLVGMFIAGAQEYYEYTYIKAMADTEPGRGPFTNALKNNEALAKKLNELIKKDAPSVWQNQYKNGLNEITKDDINDIKNGNRFGVRVLEGNKVEYTLVSSASYFPTLFTYSCFLPVNQHYIDEISFAKFGGSNSQILYCGPYLLKSADERYIKYVRNESYWNKDETIILGEVNYTVIAEAEYHTTREEFEAGRIDGFAVNSQDTDGWEIYIEGPDGEGTIQNPYDGRVNSKLNDTIGSMYGSNIHMNRVKNGVGSWATESTPASLANTERALSITEVRKAILSALPYEEYFTRYGTDKTLQTQEMVHTYVPKGFVTNDLGNDYVEDNYLNVYAQHKGLEVGSFEDEFDPNTPVDERTAAWYHHPGQYDSRILSTAEMNALVDEALHAVDLYNAIPENTQISLPINVEYYSAWHDETTKSYDEPVIELMNKALNKGSSEKKYFNVIPTDKIKSNEEAQEVSQAGGFDYAPVLWGWGADYGDPLTFMNTYRKGNGDWSSIFPFVGEGAGEDEEGNPLPGAMSWKIDETTGDLVEFELLGEYTELVDLGAAETDDLNTRYNYFAEAEYLLINELCFYQPQVNDGQGWSVSVSCAASYYGPQGSFGLANDRLTGLYVFTREDMLTGDDRKHAREQFELNKAAYIEALKASIEADKEAGRENRNTAALNIY